MPGFCAHLSVVVPVYNEASNILPLIREIQSALQPRLAQYEIIYVNDGSTDETATILKEAQQSYSVLRVIHHQHCCGQSASVRTGVKAARHDWIATLDGDGQNDPMDILNLLTVWQPDIVMLCGNRRHARQDSWIKRLSSVVANTVRARVLGDNTPDTGCGLKVFRRDVFLDLPWFDHMHRFLPALVLRQGGAIASAPVHHRPRERGQSKYGTWDRLRVGVVDLLGVLWLKQRSQCPVAHED